jgi:DeoR/GlpR family transcriptional regulator of sugar metabolism
MLNCAENVIVLADSSKCGRTAPFVIGGLARFDCLACEVEPGQNLKNALDQHSVTIV